MFGHGLGAICNLKKGVGLLQVESIMRNFSTETFRQRGSVEWPSRSPDLTSLAFLFRVVRPKEPAELKNTIILE